MSIPSWARKGALVVCVDAAWRDGFSEHKPTGVPLVEGAIYTIDAVMFGRLGVAVVHLVEDGLFAYALNRFRPLVDDANDAETEREIYRRKVHQNAAPVKALEPAE